MFTCTIPESRDLKSVKLHGLYLLTGLHAFVAHIRSAMAALEVIQVQEKGLRDLQCYVQISMSLTKIKFAILSEWKGEVSINSQPAAEQLVYRSSYTSAFGKQGCIEVEMTFNKRTSE